MIFVTVGTNETPFDRLIEAVALFPAGEPVVVQHGSSSVRPARATCVDYLPFDDLISHIRRARIVVTHAGAGSTLVALANGKRPIVVPRLKRFGEAVDDHQVAFGQRLHRLGLVTYVSKPQQLLAALSSPPSATVPSNGRGDPPSELAVDVRRYLAGCGVPTPMTGRRHRGGSPRLRRASRLRSD